MPRKPKKPLKPKETILSTFNIPIPLKTELRLEAARRDVKMKDIVVQALTIYLQTTR